ncbi:MAG: transaldolase [Thermogemmatispora sp.]|uniref:transaldolase n=1 Tax=Thermogemmatispora sp. TaxID=1968838 RepID=UPI0026051E65|nr:transaldolase [Thermogemmatispora sp.]MBX5456166.1 transaldolase [Thermogemmatispora sp.]
MANPLLQLKEYGQSVWYDNIDRAQLESGEFKRLLEEDGITGVTANPTIFDKAISSGHAYDAQIEELIRQGKEVEEIYDALVVRDVQTVADLLRPIYERSAGVDGYVSLEVSPDLAHDTEGTLAAVRRYWQLVNRPNLMIKIPATPEGLPAIQQALTEGYNINITLIFSIETYREVAEAYLTALENRNAEGQDISGIASVASFFVSRVDTLVDKLLEEKIKASNDPAEQARLRSLQGKAAIANARLVYQEFKRIFGSPRFAALRQLGAHVQRPLWASTSTKNPAYRDVLYAEELIGPDTVDTMPYETIEKFRDHGRVRYSIEDDLDGARALFKELEQLGISYEAVTQQLLDEGVQKFADSYHQLLNSIRARQQALKERQVSR